MRLEKYNQWAAGMQENIVNKTTTHVSFFLSHSKNLKLQFFLCFDLIFPPIKTIDEKENFGPSLGGGNTASQTPGTIKEKRKIIGPTPTKNILTFDANENNSKSKRDISPIRVPNIDDIWSKYE